MSCAELRAQADAYARATLSAAEATAFEAHLTTCASCTAFLEAAEAPPERTAALPKSVDPGRDLWPGIRERLGKSGVGRGRIAVRGWLLAAAAVLLIAVSSGVTVLLLRRFSGTAAIQQAITLSPLEAQYASAAAELGVALARARGQLAPETIAIIERNLAVIDSALAESRRALAGDPHNAMLEQLVIAAWRQKMDFLRRATALSPAS
ncbi:MAG TPA: zf-HC2 domain-containing protein [Gemmatimonadales bacterium]|jgi:hypothetical protein|nr:zf-HC2 domain-containing protein [Gemmatimonadales bacterium]